MHRADREVGAVQAVVEAVEAVEAEGNPGDLPDARHSQGQTDRVQLNPGKRRPRRRKSCCSCRKA